MSTDFSGQNLCGASFQNQDLRGADFSRADVRSADFRGANLAEANFSHARTGLQGRWALTLIVGCGLLSGSCALISAFMGSIVFNVLQNLHPGDILIGVVEVVVLGIFYGMTVRQGLPKATGALVAMGFWVVILAWATAWAGAGAGSNPVIIAVIMGVALAIGVGTTLGVAVSAALAMAVAGFGAVAATELLALLGTIPGAMAGANVQIGTIPLPGNEVKLLSLIWAGVGAMVGTYVGWQALSGDRKQAFIYNLAIALAAIKGTNFQGANLSYANFYQAELKGLDLRRAVLTRTQWFRLKRYSLVRTGNTYLQDAQIRRLLITGQGASQDFRHKNLQGVYLEGANLAQADFTGAVLSYANLVNTDLTGAIFKQTQLDGADLTRASLTGAYLEDWGVTNTTRLDFIDCQYVFLHVPTPEQPNPRRKPDNYRETFAPGDFVEFIKPISHTLDLYHTQGVDPRSIAIAYKKLEELYPEACLELVALEKRGQNLLLRVKTAEVVDHSLLSAEYFHTYNQFKFMPDHSIGLSGILEGDRVRNLETMILTALTRPPSPRNTDPWAVFGSEKPTPAPPETLLTRTQRLTHHAIIGLQSTNTPKALKLAEFLQQLQTILVATSEFSEEDQITALEQIRILAEVGLENPDSSHRKAAKTALHLLKGSFMDLSTPAPLMDASEVLPKIATLLGLEL
ncbi:pentapeptide repeat-containing protein [Spirulina subsalsa]|uniref:pentapeptide repeat-containing protein n=1 Tax=Spirulina subsalsa TaxID=54311 RepID=UPI0002EB4FF6|nr:pentapeptide repeat-containing protein [Spirulina subsalsa]